MALNTAAQNPNTFDVAAPRADFGSYRGSCSWFERPLSGNTIGDEIKMVDMGHVTFVWDGSNWVNPVAAYSANIAGAHTIDRSNLETMLNATGAVAVTIPNDTVLELTTQPTYRACVGVYQEGAGAPTFTPGAGVSAIAGTPKAAGAGVAHGIMRVGANAWAYL